VAFIPIEGVINAWVPGHERSARWVAWLLNKLVEKHYTPKIEPHIAVVHAALRRPMRVLNKTEPDLIARVVHAIPEEIMVELLPLVDEIREYERGGARVPSAAVREESRNRLGRRVVGDQFAEERLVLD